MGSDLVFFKVLYGSGVANSICLPLKVVTCVDFAHSNMTLSQIANDDAKLSYGDKYVGVVTQDKLASLQVGEYAITVDSDSNHMHRTWRIDNKVVEGWFVNGEETAPVEIGYYTCAGAVDGVHTDAQRKFELVEQMFKEASQKIDELTGQVITYKFTLESEQDRGNKLSAELINTENLLDDSRRSTVTRADECRKMMLEVEKFRKNADKDLTALQELTSELSELKRQLYEKDREIASLREEAMYAHRGGSTPMKTSTVQATPEYDEIIARIKVFDKTRLLSRKERDQLLKDKTQMK